MPIVYASPVMESGDGLFARQWDATNPGACTGDSMTSGWSCLVSSNVESQSRAGQQHSCARV